MTGKRKRGDRRPRATGWLRPIVGMTAGGICGFLTYWSGAAIAATSDLINTPRGQLATEFSRPMYTFTYWEIVLVIVGAVVGAIVVRYSWRSAGLLGYIGLFSVISGFVVYSVTVSIPQVPSEERWLSYALLTAEAGGLGLIFLFTFYSVDAVTRKRWNRRPEQRPWDPDLLPKVAIEIPTYNEPVDVVEQTIAHAVHQDYPADRFTVVVADDSTDPEIREATKAACERLGAVHHTRPERTGFKAGALNHATSRLPGDVELVAVVDADYWVRKDYLRSIVGYFTDPDLSFVQTPQDYRNVDESFLTRYYKRAEAYFYHGIMPSRNEQNAIIFCGTMGIIRRSALEDVGGFAEDQICEDAELSVRLAAHGWNSLYVDESFGKGLTPAVFEAYKSQFYRWAFGNVKILYTRTGTIMRSNMSKRQKFDFMVANLHWFDGFFVTTIALALMYLGLGPVLGYDAVTHHQNEIMLLGLIPFALMIDSFVRLRMILGRAGHRSIKDTFLVQGIWFSIKVTNMIAVTKCTLGFKTPFIRTPKAPGRRLGRFRSLLRAVRLSPIETTIGLALVGVGAMNLLPQYQIASGAASHLLPAWLGLYALFFLSAPIYAYMSYRTLTPLRYRGLPLVRPDEMGDGPADRSAARRGRGLPTQAPDVQDRRGPWRREVPGRHAL